MEIDRLSPVLTHANELLARTFGEYLGDDPLGHFNFGDPNKFALFSGKKLGKFDAWKDKVYLNIITDPLGTAVHELLHANSFSDDWLPSDTGSPDNLVSFRGFEIQLVSADRRKVKGIYHRALNEAVTECLTLKAYPEARPAYKYILPIAYELADGIQFQNVARLYFQEGYCGLEDFCVISSFGLSELEQKVEYLYKHS